MKKKLSESLETIGDKLNPRQELFCRYYATNKDFFGSGIDAYAEAYEVDVSRPNWRDSVYVSASRLLSRDKIIARISLLLEETGFNDSVVDRELSFLITQHADFSNKLGAIREYNKLKKRIDDKQVLTIILPSPIYNGKSKAKK